MVTTSIHCNKVPKKRRQRRRHVCLFGTSADPPTGEGGHVGVVRALVNYFESNNDAEQQEHKQQNHVDEIRILPVYHHPFTSKRKRLQPFHHRFRMCELAFGPLCPSSSTSKRTTGEMQKRDGILVRVTQDEKRCFESMAKDKDDEAIQNLRVGTADLLEMLLKEEPDTDFTFCMGSDTFLDLTSFKWKRSRDVLKLLEGRLLVVYRKQAQPDRRFNVSSEKEETEKKSSLQELKDRIDDVNETQNCHARLLEVDTLEAISSTMIRSTEKIEELLSLNHGSAGEQEQEQDEKDEQNKLVVPAVVQYMKDHSLYCFADTSSNETARKTSNGNSISDTEQTNGV